MADNETPERDMRAEVKIELDFPVEIDGRTITEITMRRPKGKDNLLASKAKGNDLEKGIALFAQLTGEPPEVLLELDEVDLEKLGAQHTAFTARQTGATAS